LVVPVFPSATFLPPFDFQLEAFPQKALEDDEIDLEADMDWMKRLQFAMRRGLAPPFLRPTAKQTPFILGILGNTDAISPFSFINVSKNVFL